MEGTGVGADRMAGDSLPAAAFGFLEQRDRAGDLSLFSEGRIGVRESCCTILRLAFTDNGPWMFCL